jgi:hypothetical protein
MLCRWHWHINTAHEVARQMQVRGEPIDGDLRDQVLELNKDNDAAPI